jgi:hypothetical protein
MRCEGYVHIGDKHEQDTFLVADRAEFRSKSQVQKNCRFHHIFGFEFHKTDLGFQKYISVIFPHSF